MKELSIEEKAKAYDSMFERLKDFRFEYRFSAFGDVIEKHFPELRESNDEKIRKGLIAFLEELSKLGKNTNFDKWSKSDCADWIVWLEKQCEQKHTAEEVLIKAGLKSYKDGDQWCVLLGDNIQEGICGFGNTIEDALYAFLKDLIASRGEQKPTDKVESKLKIEVNKWYICISQYCNCIEGRCYMASADGRIIDDFGTEYDMHSDAYKYFRLWTIADAKDGDVLYESSTNTILMFRSQTCGWIKVYCDLWTNKISLPIPDSAAYGRVREMDLKPATKEQRDLLFKKMKEAGYEWDNEKKELKKVEQKHTEWSDTDYVMQRAALEILIASPKTVASTILKESVIVWLQSLKNRLQPKLKWSDEDEEMIDSIIGNIKYLYSIGSCDNATVDKKVNWLKSLTNRALPQPKREWSEEDEKMRAAVLQLITDSEKENCWNCVYCNDKEIYFSDIISWLKSLRPQSFDFSDEELAQAEKDAFNNALDKIEYTSDEPTFADGWWAAIDFVRKKSLRPRKQCCNDIPSREYILNVWELGNYWKELTNGVCSTEYGTELEYIQKHWKEGGYYDKISACPQKQWKPSEEQMIALKCAITTADEKWVCMNTKDLESLYEDLKKLREEFTFC